MTVLLTKVVILALTVQLHALFGKANVNKRLKFFNLRLL
jgi:hypothetical protein